MVSSPLGDRLTIKNITSWFADRHGADYERKITPKWIGHIVRRRLHLATYQSDGVFVLSLTDKTKAQLAQLYARYGVQLPEAEAESSERVA